ncbi:MAG: LLM class flavin-dependent oxidoreductase, partial [Acidimicrobiaceae bacterium]|nr:LLM class flavin-dependent oxidoreductase [Acidimicrobiaceae bacterium]HAB56904.1 LLM class flavin-dependent oxidoreductase [Acidimicrobiaceae bacterium]
YHRYWVAEHHNTLGLAGSAPEILVGHIAQATETLRVGTGGVMLPHYSPLKVAESFKVLSALHPGRIDLGLGRAPGSDQVTAVALSQTRQPPSAQHYPAMVAELDGWLRNALPEESPFHGRVTATPVVEEPPPIFLLGSSPDSAALAAHFGLPLAFADFITMADGPSITHAYRRQYDADGRNAEPYVLIAASVICAETDDEAQALAEPVKLWRQRGLSGPIPTPEETAVHRPGPLDIPAQRKPMIVGSPATVKAGVEEMVRAYGADEFMAVTIVWSHEARARSYELLADAFAL